MRGERGFTMVETLVVIAIMGILSAIAIPSLYKWRQSAECKEAAWGILADMRLGKQSALSTNLEHRVEIDMDARRYRLARGNMPSASTSWTAIDGWAELAANVNWAGGAACDGNTDMDVVFRPNGSAETEVICIKDAADAVKYRVSVNATSGRAVIN